MISVCKLLCGFVQVVLGSCGLVFLCAWAEHEGCPIVQFQTSGSGALFTAFGQVVGGVLLAIIGLDYSARRHLQRVSKSIKEETATIKALPRFQQSVELAESQECEENAEKRLRELAGQVNGLRDNTVIQFKRALCDSIEFSSARRAGALLSEARAGMKDATREQKSELDTVTGALYLRHLNKAGKVADESNKALRGRGSLCMGALLGITFCCYWPDPLAYGLMRRWMDVSASEQIPVALSGALVVGFMIGAGLACKTLGKHLWQAFEQPEEGAWF